MTTVFDLVRTSLFFLHRPSKKRAASCEVQPPLVCVAERFLRFCAIKPSQMCPVAIGEIRLCLHSHAVSSFNSQNKRKMLSCIGHNNRWSKTITDRSLENRYVRRGRMSNVHLRKPHSTWTPYLNTDVTDFNIDTSLFNPLKHKVHPKQHLCTELLSQTTKRVHYKDQSINAVNCLCWESIESTNTFCKKDAITECQSRWYIHLPCFKGLIVCIVFKFCCVSLLLIICFKYQLL